MFEVKKLTPNSYSLIPTEKFAFEIIEISFEVKEIEEWSSGNFYGKNYILLPKIIVKGE